VVLKATMVCIHTVEEISTDMKRQLSATLRSCDKVVTLPQAQRSPESGTFKNSVFTLDGAQAGVPLSVFSDNWGTGLSAIELCDADVEPLLRDVEYRKQKMELLATGIASDISDPSVSVGPDLIGDESDRDMRSDWTPGFDSSSCLVGLYCGEHSRPPSHGLSGLSGLSGQNRAHRVAYLVCRAGAGVAGATFHSRLIGALKAGKSLDEALLSGDSPGPQALRRVSAAGSRNRARILKTASDILGFKHVQTVNDHAAMAYERCAVASIDVNSNTLQKADGTTHWVYNTGLDCASNHGIISSSNVADGFIVFLSTTEGRGLVVRNDASSSIPFSSVRIASNKDIAQKMATNLERDCLKGVMSHPDMEFVRERFTWNNRNVGEGADDVTPLCLNGTHKEEYFTSSFARELGLDKAALVRLRPELVCLAGVDAGKLRPIVSKWGALRNKRSAHGEVSKK
tara:strand:+ start:1491 stop:2858 length:1368 start_codon:yes stop_codon:yes gene_type:complete